MSKADELLRVRKVVFLDSSQRSAKTSQSRVGRCCICRIGLDEEIQIFCGAGLRMKRNRLSANHQVFNVVGVEGRQAF